VARVHGRSLFPLPGCLRSRLLWSIGEAERLKGEAPHNAEIIVVFFTTYTTLIQRGYLSVFLQNLFREDLFYADKEFTVWSLTGPDGSEERKSFKLFSEMFQELYPGYTLEPMEHIRAMPSTPVLNLEQLTALFKSKDAELWERNRWIFEREGVFLDG